MWNTVGEMLAASESLRAGGDLQGGGRNGGWMLEAVDANQGKHRHQREHDGSQCQNARAEPSQHCPTHPPGARGEPTTQHCSDEQPGDTEDQIHAG